jgi:DNA polymerase I-like protein with 3'-5' exonuclease and polymerase domains
MQAFDTETFLITDGNLAPDLVCVSYAQPDYSSQLYHALDGSPTFRSMADLALWNNTPVIGANTAYDMAVMLAHDPALAERIWTLYDRGLVRDVIMRQKMIDIARGCYCGFRRSEDGKVYQIGYSLAELAKRHLGQELDKGAETWRLRYSELYEIPLYEWPREARQYAEDDAVATIAVYQAQEVDSALLLDEPARCRTAWMLHLMSCYGIKTDPEAVRAFVETTRKSSEELKAVLVNWGLVRAKGTRDTKEAKALMVRVCQAKGLEVVKTDGGDVALDDATCKKTGDPILAAYANYSSLAKVVSTDLPILLKGIKTPVQTRFEPLLETGRTSSSAPNIQNIKRLVGMRECFRPRPGRVFVDADYAMLELCTWAQTCLWALGRSRLAEVLNAGDDPHLAFAAQILGITYDEAKVQRKAGNKEVEQRRLVAKVGNFGFPGGLGAESFVEYAASSYKVTITEEQAKELKRFWLNQWPEARAYFDWIAKKEGENGISLQRFVCGSWRSGMRYTAACNDPFQSLGATAATWAGYDLARACYYEKEHILFGSRPVNFIHDQYLVEVLDDELAHDRAMAVADIMVKAAKRAIPDVTPKVEPLLCRYWSKDAKALYAKARARAVALIAIDPGKETGFAEFEGDVLSFATVCSEEQCLVFIENAAPIRQGKPAGDCVIEVPQIYPGQKQKGDQNDLVKVALMVGRYMHCATACGFRVTLFKPRDWKGQLPKDVCWQRVRETLTAYELSKMEKISKSRAHNMHDAIGLGTRFQKRWR